MVLVDRICDVCARSETSWGGRRPPTAPGTLPQPEGALQTFFYTPRVCSHGDHLADILLVDDETFLHEIYSDFLNLHGHKVVGIAYNGEEAVALFRSLPRKPDIVIMDQRMPVKSGVDATREILAITPGTRVVFSSADIHARKISAEAGAVAFVQKPFTLEELLRVLEGVLAGPEPAKSSTGKKG